jgi:tetratricopeptide (TPR) repeat protein
MQKYLLSLASLCLYFLAFKAISPDKHPYDVFPDADKITEHVKAYNALIKQYSGPDGKDDTALFGQLLELKDGKDLQQDVANDLFDQSEKKNIPFEGYFDNLDSIYQHKLIVEYDYNDLQILNCKQIKQTDTGVINFAYVKFTKILQFNGQTKRLTEIAAVNLNNYKIPIFFLPDDSVNNKGMCYDEIKKLANTNGPASEPVNTLNGKFKNELKQADLLYKEGQFEHAENLYETIVIKFPVESKKNNIENKINICKTELSKINSDRCYSRLMVSADYYYNRGIFNKATDFYKNALQYKPDDTRALSGLKKCADNSDLHFVKDEINTAHQLTAENQENYGKAFKILVDVEPSGQLSTADYYFLIENLYQKNPVVLTEMNYSDEDAENYLNIYRYKLRMAGEREQRKEIRADVIRLLADILVSDRTTHTYIRTIKYYPTWVIHSRSNRQTIINPNKSGYVKKEHFNLKPNSLGIQNKSIQPANNSSITPGPKPSLFKKIGNGINKLNETLSNSSGNQPANLNNKGQNEPAAESQGQQSGGNNSSPPKKTSFFNKLIKSIPNNKNSSTTEKKPATKKQTTKKST